MARQYENIYTHHTRTLAGNCEAQRFSPLTVLWKKNNVIMFFLFFFSLVCLESLFPSGSVTKPFTTAGIFQLIGEGKFELDSLMAPLVNPALEAWNGSSIESLFGQNSFMEKVTLRHLLSTCCSTVAHTVGKSSTHTHIYIYILIVIRGVTRTV